MVVVSDFRGPRDWRTPLMRLLSRHHVIAVEVRDPREQELPAVGDLWLVDPETGRQLRVDTNRRKIRERFAARAAEERDGACPRAAPHRRGAHRAVDVGRLAARAGAPHEPRARRGGAGELRVAASRCWGCSLVPLVVALYLRRRSGGGAGTRCASPTSTCSAASSRGSPGLRRHLPPLLFLLALTALTVAIARPHVNVDVAREEATVMLVTDSSGSMQATDVSPEPPRWPRATPPRGSPTGCPRSSGSAS